MQALIESITPVATDVVEIVLAPVDTPFEHYSPGSHVDFFLPGIGARQYSLTGDGVVYRFMIQRENQGRGGSTFIHSSLQRGDLIEVSQPRNTFPLKRGKPLLFIAGGIGITPFLSMMKALDESEFGLLYFCRERARVVDDPRLMQLEKTGVATISLGLSPELTLASIERKIESYAGDLRVYCCGPKALNTSVQSICAHRSGVEFYSESFTPLEYDVKSPSSGFHVVLKKSGSRVYVPPEKSILEAIRDFGVDLQSSCESGLCGTCKVSYESGRVDHRDLVLSDEERKTTILVCCSRSLSDELVLEI
jgi:ferredoxin-NADP reductase